MKKKEDPKPEAPKHPKVNMHSKMTPLQRFTLEGTNSPSVTFFFFFFIFTLVTGPRRSLSLKLSDNRGCIGSV